MVLSHVPIGQNETTTTISALVERVASLDINVKNLEVKFQCASFKRNDLDDRKEVEPISKALTKNADRQAGMQDVWDQIKTDICNFLSATSKITNFNKQQWLDLMSRNQDSTKGGQGCISKGQKKKMLALWAQFEGSK